jgi:serine/threonine-protein kinase
MDESRSAPVLEGEVLAGKYRVERVLGEGGMGVVVAARHIQLEQLVALKFVLASTLQNAQAVERFLREARAAVKLKSEHVAKVLDVGTLESGAPYMVMEYLEGSDLAQLLEQRGPLPIETACDFVLQACEAVAEAHSLGIVHRDLKPQNLFVTRRVGGSALIKVLDFGISKMLWPDSAPSGALTQTRAVMGSPLYMAPEQMRSSRSVDTRADVWALGVVLYELLTARLPFEAESMPELCLKVVQDPPPPITESRPDVPAQVVAVIAKCLEKDPTNRYANAGELASALEPFVPAASRVVAERARMAIGSMGATQLLPPETPAPEAQGPTAVSAAPLAGSKPVGTGSPALVPATALSGSMAAVTAEPPKAKRPVALFAAIAVVAVAAIGIGIWAVVAFGHGGSGSASGAAGGGATVAATATTTATAMTTVTAIGAEAGTATGTGTATAAAGATTTAAGVGTGLKGIAPKPTGTKTVTKVTHDDDIPALR